MPSSGTRPKRPPLLLLALFASVAPGSLAAPGVQVAKAAQPQAPQKANVPVISVSEVRPGMTGYGLTVFSGTEPDRFAVRVVGVIKQFLPKQDIILIKAEDPRLTHSGIAQGMSGSPIFIEGKLAGALAYGWSFSKDPLAGVTPIDNMLTEMRRVRRGQNHDPVVASRSGTERPTPMPASLLEEAKNLRPAAVPLSVSGLSPGALAELKDALAPYNIVPQQAAGGARGTATGPGAQRFIPGGSIAVELIRGDISAAGTGTVTYVEGNQVIGFGHPMFNLGEAYFPVATAEVVSFMPSLAQSFKIASPLKTIGTLVQDRQACIVAESGGSAPMIPFVVKLSGEKVPEQIFRTEIARHRFLTPMLLSAVASSAVQHGVQDTSDAVVRLNSQVKVKGFAPLVRTDAYFSAEGVGQRTLLSAPALRQVQELLFNPFAPAEIESVSLDVTVTYRANYAEILSLGAASDEVEPGTKPSLYVTLRPYGKAPIVQTIPLDVPQNMAGQTLRIEVSAGNLVRPEVAPPETLSQLVENLRKGYSSQSFVVTVNTLEDGVALHGTLVPNLPASIVATLRSPSVSKRPEIYKPLSRFAVDAGRVLAGRQELTLKVRESTNN